MMVMIMMVGVTVGELKYLQYMKYVITKSKHLYSIDKNLVYLNGKENDVKAIL